MSLSCADAGAAAMAEQETAAKTANAGKRMKKLRTIGTRGIIVMNWGNLKAFCLHKE
jgi:hypothetical protein